MQIKFNDTDKTYEITTFRKDGDNLIILKGPDLPADNTSGFVMMQDSGAVTADYSGYITKYNVLTTAPAGVVLLSNKEDYVETADNPASRYWYVPPEENIIEDVDPLTNEELMECVADLMYEVSMNNLGL